IHTTVSEAVWLKAKRCKDSVQRTAPHGSAACNQRRFWSLWAVKVTSRGQSFETFAVKICNQQLTGEHSSPLQSADGSL
ncbi:MAG: hypothetical protein IJN27_07250, partial [Oscillospiraceae bacterium]|nr:hypothetical protein [Oscillospiraceae bacterium]